MSSGVPIVAPELPDTSGVLNRTNAVLVQPDNLTAAQKAIRRVFEDKTWSRELAKQEVIAKKAGTAVHILDRYHIMTHLSKAIDEVRAQEARELKENGYEAVLTKTRWLLLKRPEHLTATQGTRLADLLRYKDY